MLTSPILRNLPYVDIELRDAHGRRWWRDHGGHLRKGKSSGSRPASGVWRAVTHGLRPAMYVTPKTVPVPTPITRPLGGLAALVLLGRPCVPGPLQIAGAIGVGRLTVTAPSRRASRSSPRPGHRDRVRRGRIAALLTPDRQPRKVVLAQRVAGVLDPCAHSDEERVFDLLADGLAFLVEVQHLDEVGTLAGELLVADGVDVELVAGDVLVLRARGGLEVDDRELVGVQAPDEVDAAVDGDAGRDVDLDLLFAVDWSARDRLPCSSK